MTEPVTVVCVLKTSAAYNPSWVHALRAGVARWLPQANFVALADQDVGPGWRPLANPWPRHWCLVNWFAPGLFTGRVIAVGLDTLMVGDLSDIAAYDGPLAGIDDFYMPKLLASGVMSWTGDEAAPIYEAFLKDPDGIMSRFPRMDPWMRTIVPKAERLQRHFPGQIISYKAHGRSALPAGSRICCFHGKPGITDLPGTSWARAEWDTRLRDDNATQRMGR